MTINPNELPEKLKKLDRFHDYNRILNWSCGSEFDLEHFRVTLYDEDGQPYELDLEGMRTAHAGTNIVDGITAAIKTAAEAECDRWRDQAKDAGFDTDVLPSNLLNDLFVALPDDIEAADSDDGEVDQAA